MNKTHSTVDHEEIQRWAEERGAQPARVKETGAPGDVGVLRFDFPGVGAEESLEPVSWDEFFRKFDEKNLALVYQESTESGERSNFNKLVDRATLEAPERKRRPSRKAAPARKKKAAPKRAKAAPAKRAAPRKATTGRKAAGKKKPAARKTTQRAPSTRATRTTRATRATRATRSRRAA